MTKFVPVLAAIIMAIGGCSAFNDTRNPDRAMAYTMHIADSLVQVMAFDEAAARYAALAEDHPRSSLYPTAVHKAAVLYARTIRTARNDSLALFWFTTYLALPLKIPEREDAQLSMTLLQHIIALRNEGVRRRAEADSLSVMTKSQSASLVADSHRMQELELEVQQAHRELRKMKEIDLQMSKSRVKR